MLERTDQHRAHLMIVHGFVVTMSPTRTVYSDGAIVIRGRHIADVGPTAPMRAKYYAPSIIDATGMLIIPGLIDGHNHPNQFLSRGIGDDVDVPVWLDRIFAYEAHMT